MTVTPDDFQEFLPEGSWFKEFITLFPYSEPPISYILFSAMQMMGAILGRKVEMPYDVHTVRPMLNLLLIGPSGTGKSTCVKMAKELRKHMGGDRSPQFIDGAATKERLHQDLVKNPHAIIFAPELATFFGKEQYKEGLIGYVTQLLDYEDIVENRTKGEKDPQVVVEPEVSILGASTRDWLVEALPSSAGKGGFLPRFLLLYEEGPRQKVANPHRMGTPAEREQLAIRKAKAHEEFVHLMYKAMAQGQFDYTDQEAADCFANWYDGFNMHSGLLEPFANRAREMILRMALLLAVSCGESGISTECVECGIKLYNYVFSRLHKVNAPTTAIGKTLSAVLDAIPKDAEGITDVGLFRALRGSHDARTIKQALASLHESQDVEKHPETKNWLRVSEAKGA